MSDDTPDTHVESAEPSMEDILASIRRIIADEDVSSAAGVASVAAGLDVPAESFTILDGVTADSAQDGDDLATIDGEDTAVEEHMSSDIDFMLSELDDGGSVDVLDLDMLEDNEVSVSDSDSIAKKLTGLSAVAAAGLGAVASAGVATAKSVAEARKSPTPEFLGGDEDGSDFETLDLMMEDADTPSSLAMDTESGLSDFLTIPDSDNLQPEDDIDALLGELLGDDDAGITYSDSVTDPAAHMLENENTDDVHDELLADLLGDESDNELEMPASTQPPEDIDLVKSLMADLTDDPYAEASTKEDTAETELVDDILALSMEDEAALQSAANVHGEEMDDPFFINVDNEASPDVVSSSLSEIAQAAEADAERHERGRGFADAGFVAGAGMLAASAGPVAAVVGGANASTEDETLDYEEAEDVLAAINPSGGEEDVPSFEAAFEETNIESTQETLPSQETADMPKAAAKKDNIINEVTEEATAGAFASLNQIVETRAVVEERGDRIGDLVQEALRPMLKEWLDKNLKGIVERAVTKEVKRISSGK